MYPMPIFEIGNHVEIQGVVTVLHNGMPRRTMIGYFQGIILRDRGKGFWLALLWETNQHVLLHHSAVSSVDPGIKTYVMDVRPVPEQDCGKPLNFL